MIEKLVSIAKNEIGYLEKKTNSQLDNKTANAGRGNYTKYARDLDNIPGFYNGKKNGYAWCDVFVDWCFVQAFGVDKAKELLLQPNQSLGAGCTYSANYYKKAGQFHSSPKVGDQIFFYNSSNSICHTGLVVKVDSTYVYTVEGNTSSDPGVVDNGGSVNDKKYKLNYSRIAGYGRPKYGEEYKEPDKKEDTTSKSDVIAVDGVWGPATTKKAQRVFGTTVDGIVSNQYSMYKSKNPGLSSATFEWESKPGKSGSSLIKAIQKQVGIKQDGYIGPNTIKAMQKWLGTTQDGYVSRPSLMVKAFQKWLNSR